MVRVCTVNRKPHLETKGDFGELTDFSRPAAFTGKILSHKVYFEMLVGQAIPFSKHWTLFTTIFVDGILKQNNWIKKYYGIVVSQYFVLIIKMHALCFKNVMCRETHTYFTWSLTTNFLKFLLIELILTLTRLKKIRGGYTWFDTWLTGHAEREVCWLRGLQADISMLNTLALNFYSSCLSPHEFWDHRIAPQCLGNFKTFPHKNRPPWSSAL